MPPGFSAPECRPLTTVDEFLSWTPAADLDTPFCQVSTCRHCRTCPLAKQMTHRMQPSGPP